MQFSLCSAKRIALVGPFGSPTRSTGRYGVVPQRRLASVAPRSQQQLSSSQCSSGEEGQQWQQQIQAAAAGAPVTLASLLALWAATELPAAAAGELSGSAPASSYYVSLGLFVLTVPGAWCGRGSGCLGATAGRASHQPARGPRAP